jgi:hypothetical protein
MGSIVVVDGSVVVVGGKYNVTGTVEVVVVEVVVVDVEVVVEELVVDEVVSGTVDVVCGSTVVSGRTLDVVDSGIVVVRTAIDCCCVVVVTD